MNETVSALIRDVKERACPEANVLPMASERELLDMATDIGASGLLDEIVMADGLILDGRNRWVACQLARVEPKVTAWDGQGSRMDFVLSKNLHRRHLDAGQKAAAAAEAMPIYEAEAKERQGTRSDLVELIPPSDSGKARDFAAEQFDVNPRYVQDAKRFKDNSPEVFDRVKSGEWSIPQARQAERIQAAAPEVFQRVTAGEQTIPEAAAFVFSEPAKETEEERAYYSLSKFRLWTRLDPDDVASVCAEPGLSANSFQELSDWIGRVAAALRSHTKQPLRAVK